MARSTSPSIAMSAPSTIIVHMAAFEVSTTSGDSSTRTPIATSAQSCHLVHGLVITSTSSFSDKPHAPLGWPPGQETSVESLTGMILDRLLVGNLRQPATIPH